MSTHIIIHANSIITKSNAHNQIKYTDTHNINLLKKKVILTIHKHLHFTLKVGNTCNKGVQNLSHDV